MSSDNEFPIPFEESRRGLAANQEEKAAVGRLGQYLASRGVNRPTIGEGRKKRRSGNIELPTGGKPGQRNPTGSRRDVDGDGWADEGTTKPVWVGTESQAGKPNTVARLSSGMVQLSPTERHDYGALVASKKVQAKDVKGKGGEYRIVITTSGTVAAFLDSDIEKERNNLLDRFNELGKNPFTNKEAPLALKDIDDRDVLRGLLDDQRKIKPSAGMQVYLSGKGIEVFGIETREKHRRRGLATEMFNFHREVFPDQDLQHSDALTDDGRAFADATPTVSVSAKLSSGKGRNTKLNVTRYGKDDEYAQVSSFEIDGKVFEISRGGDSPGRDMYNGYISAFDEDKNVAYIDYNMDTENKKAVVAMVFTDEEYRRQGIAEALLDSFVTENPDYEISPGGTTDEGGDWWRSVTGGDGPIKAEKATQTQEGLFSPRKGEQGDSGSRLSSGKKYQEIVDSQPSLSEDKKQSIANFLDDIVSEEFQKEDIYVLDTGPTPPRPPGMPEPKPRQILKDDEKRTLEKERVRNLLAEVFKGEMTLDKDVIITADDGTQLNIGKKVLVEIMPQSSYAPAIKVKKASEKDLAEQDELGLYEENIKEGDLVTELQLEFRIKPLPEYSDALLAIFNDEDGKRYISREDGTPALATGYRTFIQVSGDDKDVRIVSHDSFYINNRAQGQGIGSVFNARNEKLYNELDVRSIITWGNSGSGSTGAVHWPKNGFSWAGEKDKQDFIKLIDEAIVNTPEMFSEEDRKKISSLYRKNNDTGLFETEATAEEFVDFPKADEVFSNANAQFFYSRPLRELAGASSGSSGSARLSSGRAPRYPREPTLGAFLEGAQERFEGVDSWEEFKERYAETEMVFLDYETTGLDFDELVL
jgi:GNAT superfamily N-acetyltransferase